MKNNKKEFYPSKSKKHFSLSKTAISIAVAQMLTVNANAFNYEVDHNGDERTDGAEMDGMCTLREAIARANLNDPAGGGNDCDPTGTTGSDTITFNLTTLSTITLNNSSLGNDLGLIIDDDLTIQGPGTAADVVIFWQQDALSMTPMLLFENTQTGTNTLADISINNITLNGASPSGGTGGAFVAAADTMVNMDSVVITNNGGTKGGAGYIDQLADVTISNSMITSNSVDNSGAAFYVNGDEDNFPNDLGKLTLINSEVSGNVSGASAGAIHTIGATVISNSMITDNYAPAIAGAILAYGGSTVIDGGSKIDNNSTSSNGGAIYSNGATLTIIDSSVSFNTAGISTGTYGGGIFFRGSATDSMTLNNATINNNSAGKSGGGIHVQDGEHSITNSKISYNRLSDNFTSFQSTGGGVRSRNSTLSISTSTINNNTAAIGGGIHTFANTLTVNNSSITNNLALSPNIGGGGLYLYIGFGRSYINNTTISENRASNGGGIFSYSGRTVITNSTISSNSSSINGGGVHIPPSLSPPIISLINSTLAFNRGSNGLRVQSGEVRLSNSILSNNQGLDCFVSGNYLTTYGNNLVESQAGCGDFTVEGVEAKLSPLQDNGGDTYTHALCIGSPAIDSADQALCSSNLTTLDQRGETRDTMCDIGSFESLTDLKCETGSFFVVPTKDGKSVIFEL